MRTNDSVADARYKKLRTLVAMGGGGAPEARAVVVVPFTFATGSPFDLASVGPSAPVVRAGLRIDVGFDGAGASLEIGTAASPGLILGPTESLPAVPGQYETDAVTTFVAPATLQLRVTPGAGATQGAGVVYFELGAPP
jgi:hypothetical protein